MCTFSIDLLQAQKNLMLTLNNIYNFHGNVCYIFNHSHYVSLIYYLEYSKPCE